VAEVLSPKHLLLGLLHQLADIFDVSVLQAILRAQPKLKFVHATEQIFIQRIAGPSSFFSARVLLKI